METIKVQMNILTPKGQADKCVESMKGMLIGWGLKKDIIEQKVLSPGEFYWVLKIESDKLPILTKKAADGEVIIKGFYRQLFKQIGRVNKLAGKFAKGGKWMIKQMEQRIKKAFEHNQQAEDFVNDLKNMKEKEFYEFISVKNRAEWDTFLEQELISVKVIEK